VKRIVDPDRQTLERMCEELQKAEEELRKALLKRDRLRRKVWNFIVCWKKEKMGGKKG